MRPASVRADVGRFMTHSRLSRMSLWLVPAGIVNERRRDEDHVPTDGHHVNIVVPSRRYEHDWACGRKRRTLRPEIALHRRSFASCRNWFEHRPDWRCEAAGLSGGAQKIYRAVLNVGPCATHHSGVFGGVAAAAGIDEYIIHHVPVRCLGCVDVDCRSVPCLISCDERHDVYRAR